MTTTKGTEISAFDLHDAEEVGQLGPEMLNHLSVGYYRLEKSVSKTYL